MISLLTSSITLCFVHLTTLIFKPIAPDVDFTFDFECVFPCIILRERRYSEREWQTNSGFDMASYRSIPNFFPED